EMIVTWPAARGASKGRALFCFLAMRQALAAAAAGFRRDFGLTPQLRGSLHFGVVVVGEIGDIKRHIVFHGDVMNVAARLEEASQAVPGGFVVSGPLPTRSARLKESRLRISARSAYGVRRSRSRP